MVEDEHRIANTIRKGLEQEKYQVEVAYDGEAGLEMASSGSFDVIVLDLMLPKMNGLDVCREVRKLGVHSPILILTARDGVESKVLGLNNGADDYLTKPFSFEELVARVRALGRRSVVAFGSKLEVADLSLEPITFQVIRAGQKINLTNVEFRLLEYLMRNKGRILSKEDIISHVWDYDADILLNTVEVYIRKLREKIDVVSGITSPLIWTVRGFGYKIEEKG